MDVGSRSMSAESAARHDPYSSLRQHGVPALAVGSIAAAFGSRSVAVIAGWEIYERTQSATAIALLGLAQFLPGLLFGIPAGQAVDRWNKQRLLIWVQLGSGSVALFMGAVSLHHQRVILPSGIFVPLDSAFRRVARYLGEPHVRIEPAIVLLYCCFFIQGILRAITIPTKTAFLAEFVARPFLVNAMTWHIGSLEVISRIAPAAAGFAVAWLHRSPATSPWAYPSIYWVNSACYVFNAICVCAVGSFHATAAHRKLSARSAFAGLVYVFRHRPLLAMYVLELLSSVMAGTVALLPIIVERVLHGEYAMLAWLQAAPSAGASVVAILLVHVAFPKRTGGVLLLAVGLSGCATIGFGLSRQVLLSWILLAITGGCDMLAVILRGTMVQVLTADHVRGRVTTLDGIFVGSASRLGTLESGGLAAAYGSVVAVVINGVGLALSAVTIALSWPELRRLSVGRRLSRAGGKECDTNGSSQ